MNDLMEFLSSQEAMIVYIIALASCLICLIIYMVEKNDIKRRQRQNTKELNKLVEKVRQELQIDPLEEYKEPIVKTVEEVITYNSIDDMLENTRPLQPITDTTLEIEEETKEELVIDDTNLIEEVVVDNSLNVVRINDEKSDIKYTTVEPDQQTAQIELQKIKDELEKEEQEKNEINNNIQLTSFEEEQEETAIISLDELIKKSKEMYEKNELTQYIEEDTAPISLDELAKQAGVSVVEHEEPFIIENVVLEEKEPEIQEVMKIDDFKTVKTNEVKKFKNSPFISPIYGIEKTNDLELENTANYEKLDKEIQKSNEFLLSLQDLQEKLKG